MNHNKKGKCAFEIMTGLARMVKPLLGCMMIAIIMGIVGNLFATFITVLGGYGILQTIKNDANIPLSVIFSFIALFSISRGILRYLEQACNHFIAFKLLARIRHKVFAALRKLAPAKLEGREKGNLISIITSDIEQLEVFYAHTISPVAIAVIYSAILTVFIGSMSFLAGVIAAVAYSLVGGVIPVINNKKGLSIGAAYRKEYGKMNTDVLDTLYGIDELVQFHQEKKRIEYLEEESRKLDELNFQLKNNERRQRVVTDAVIIISGFAVFVAGCHGVAFSSMSITDLVISVITLMSSFGPVSALSALSNNLTQTLASGNRVLELLEEQPEVMDIVDGKQEMGKDICAQNVNFAYCAGQWVLENFNLHIKRNEIHGILGESGCGKSTFLKLIMRFFETKGGCIKFGHTTVNQINTAYLRSRISYVTQETFLFSDTIENNIKIANLKATKEMVEEAAKKASIHDFITALPMGYDTKLAELGDSVSGGERQRIGLARAFLHKSDIMLLDEPTSNIDSLNESMILKSIVSEKEGRTIVLVSHRKSTMGIADRVTSLGG